MGYQLSVDTGGTFSDVVIMGQMGVQTIGKALTTPERSLGDIREAFDVAAAEIDTTLGALRAESDMLIYDTVQATFLGDRMRPPRKVAHGAVATVAVQIGRIVQQTVWDILNLISEGMIRAIHVLTTADGLNPQESTTVAGGGRQPA